MALNLCITSSFAAFPLPSSNPRIHSSSSLSSFLNSTLQSSNNFKSLSSSIIPPPSATSESPNPSPIFLPFLQEQEEIEDRKRKKIWRRTSEEHHKQEDSDSTDPRLLDFSRIVLQQKLKIQNVKVDICFDEVLVVLVGI